MADMHTGSARVRKFYQTVKLRSLIVVHSLENAGVIPLFLPFGFYLFKIVLHNLPPFFC